MRKILIGLLLAGAAATPALAGPHNRSDRQQEQSNRQQAQDNRQQAHEERQQARDDARAQRSDNRPMLNNGPRFDAQAQPRQQLERDRMSGANMDAMRAQRDSYAAQRDFYARQRDPNAGQRDAYSAQRVDEMRQRIDQRQQDFRDQRQFRQDRRGPIVSNVPRPGTQPPLRGDGNRVAALNWNRNWQHDGDHDWHRYRDHHRSIFHLGLYVDPFGWGYEPFGIGYRMWPAYYGNQYWIDPAMYDLPFAPPGCAWVRYWNDAVLVDLYTGTIVDEIPGFFW